MKYYNSFRSTTISIVPTTRIFMRYFCWIVKCIGYGLRADVHRWYFLDLNLLDKDSQPQEQPWDHWQRQNEYHVLEVPLLFSLGGAATYHHELSSREEDDAPKSLQFPEGTTRRSSHALNVLAEQKKCSISWGCHSHTTWLSRSAC